MREQIQTIPVNEAFDAHDECPFCNMERTVEQRTIRYVLGAGASYMEPDVRSVTDRTGFCRSHYKRMFDYGNPLGNALMMQTYLNGIMMEFEEQEQGFAMPAKKGLFSRKKQEPVSNSMADWAEARQQTCYLCSRLEENMERYYSTFFVLIKEPEFREKVEKSKGFCMCHFAQLLKHAETQLPEKHKEWFYTPVMELMTANLNRVKEDLDHFVEMFDYRSAGSDWRNSKDAVERTMQKLRGGYPADKVYRTDF